MTGATMNWLFLSLAARSLAASTRCLADSEQ
jgi:hypothetical protein